MRRIGGLLLLTAIVVTTGCYRAVINTGRQPNGQTIERPWAHSFIAGLVPPSITETAATCTGGIARVTTQHSFLNLLAQFVTFSIYSPMTITVECAGGDAPEDGAATVQGERTDAAAAVTEAVLRAAETGRAVWVRLE